jgi:hypothetical protein
MLSKRSGRGIAPEHMAGLSKSEMGACIGQSPYFDVYSTSHTY